MSDSDCSRPSSPGGMRFDVLQLADDRTHDLQEDVLRERQVPQPDLPALEELAQLLAVVHRVVVALLQAARIDALQRLAQVADQLVLVTAHRPRRHLGRLEARHVEDVEEQHRRVGDRRATRLGDDHRVLDAERVEHAHDLLDDVEAVLVERVVLAVVVVGLRPVVVHRQAAAEVEETERRALLLQVGVVRGRPPAPPLRMSRMFGICEPRW